MPLFARILKDELNKIAVTDEDLNETKDFLDKEKDMEKLVNFIMDSMKYETWCDVSEAEPRTMDYPGTPAQAVCEADGEIDLKEIKDKFENFDVNSLNDDEHGLAYDAAHEVIVDILNKNPKEKKVFDLYTINYKFVVEGDKLKFHVDAEPK